MRVQCKRFQVVIWSIFAMFWWVNPAYGESLKVSVLIGVSSQRNFFTDKVKEFEAQTGVSVQLIAKGDAEYKALLDQWFSERDGPDVIHWQGGERLFRYARRSQLFNLESLWQRKNLTEQFTPSSVDAVMYENMPYAIPISYYQWGFYYRKSLFSDMNLRPPETWDDFLRICRVLKNEGIEPITMGVKNRWPSAAWFDYLNLRINGLEFHRRLLTGEISYQDDRVRKVFLVWRELIQQQCFVKRRAVWDWKQAMPFLYHKKAGMTLIGNFFAAQLPDALRDDFAFFPFPEIEPTLPKYEEAPLDLFMIPAYSKNRSLAEKFLLFVAEESFQTDLNVVQGTISPNTRSPASRDYFIKTGSDVLESAAGVSQFFDRDTNALMTDKALGIFYEFLDDPNVERTLSQLENARQTSFDL